MSEEDTKEYAFDDMKEFFSKFIFTPEFKEYEHLTKDISVTNLRSKFKEPEQVRTLLEAFHILTNSKYFYDTKKIELAGYSEEEIFKTNCSNCGYEEFMSGSVNEGYCKRCKNPYGEKDVIAGIIKKPYYIEKNVRKSKFPKTHHYLLSKFVSLIITSQSRDGHLMRTFNTKRMEKEETVEDKTEVKQGFFPGTNRSIKASK